MALQKQNVSINFTKGVETKSDPFQNPLGSFASIENCIFDEDMLIKKRNGYAGLPVLPDNTSTSVTTFNGDLTAIGTKLEAYASGSMTWSNKGNIIPVGVSALSVVRSNTNQSQADTAIAANGLLCTVWTDQDPTSLTASIYKYAVCDSETGQNVIAPTTITAADATYGTPKVFLLDNYFIIVFTNKVSSLYHLKYISINTASLAVGADTDISTSYTPASTVAFDGTVFNRVLYVAWNGAAASGIKMATLSATLVLSSTVIVDAGHVATMVGVCADTTNSIIWVTYYDLPTTAGYVVARNVNLLSVLAATQIITTGTILNVTASASSGTLTTFYEVSSAYSYDSTVASNYVQYRTVTQAGSVGTATTLVRSVGLGSKSFISGGVIYVLCAFSSPYQPTYFLVNSSGNVVAKLAYSNGGGYLTKGLPSVTVDGDQLQFCYLIKDSIQSVNKGTALAAGTQTAGIYAQTGVNFATLEMGADIISSEIGKNLNMSGGFLWSYDGQVPVEQGFHLWPDSLKVTTNTGVTPTGDTTNGSTTIINMSSVSSVGIGCTITGTGIAANTTITAVTATTITLSAAATATGSGVTLTIKGSLIAQAYYYVATYEWADNQGNIYRSAPAIPITVTSTTATSTNTVSVPTLRLTYKTANPVKIVLYRWSAAQQNYYQVTYLTQPLLNSVSSDSVSFVDSQADATILGNNLLYTTGGVVENTGGPPGKSNFIFDDRLWVIDAEDNDLLWYSKQVIQGTPVEMSDLFTKFIAPNASSQGPSGPLNCGFPMDDKAILFKDAALLYFNGSGPDNTGANSQYSQPVLITATVGCNNQKSIVFQPSGLMFEFASEAGNGIWLLGRDLSTKFIGAPVQAYTRSATVQSAVNIPGSNQVRFTMSSGITLLFDYYYGRWGVFKGIPAISSTLFQGLHTYINSSGQPFQETPGQYLDGSNPVLMSFTTSWINLAGLQGYQRAYYFFLLAKYISPHKLSVQIGYDFETSPSQSYIISPDNFSDTYGSDAIYGNVSPYGGASPIEQWRNYFSRQKCQSFQISVSEIFDHSHNTVAGAGFKMSGLDIVFGTKKGWPRLPASRQTG